MPPPPQSVVWAYFKPDENDRDSAICEICLKKYSRKGRTTTSLRNHLISMHPEHFNLLLNSDNAIRFQVKQEESDEIVTPFQINTSPSEKFIHKDQQWNNNNLKSRKIDKLIGEMIALQNLPFSFVDGVGFQRLIQEIVPKYNLKESYFFDDFVCKELYGKIANKAKLLIKSFEYVSFSADVWSDPCSNTSLLSLTCHGVSENFDRSSIVLKCETFKGDQVDEIITDAFVRTLDEWKIAKEQVHCMVRGENSTAKRLTLINNLDCIVQKLQLAIRTCLESQQNIKDIKQKCEKISSYFHHSAVAQKQLEQIQDTLNQPHQKVFQDCANVNNTFYMFERFSKTKDALNLYINDDIDQILPEEWKIIECCVELLKPFEQATMELCSTETLISSVIPIVQMLLKKLDDYLTKSQQDYNPIYQTVTTLKNEVNAKFSSLNENNLFVLSTYLDPRYKRKFFNSLKEEKIKNEILNICSSSVTGSPNCTNLEISKRIKLENPFETEAKPGTSDTIRDFSLKNELALMLDSSSEDESEKLSFDSSPAAILKKELILYRNAKRISIFENPLQWWCVNSTHFKMLASVARRYLSPPPASVPSQSFSSADLIYEPLHNAINQEKTDALFFIKCNAPIFKFDY